MDPMSLVGAWIMATGLCSFAGEGGDVPLPRSLADDLVAIVEHEEEAQDKESPGPPRRPQKDDFTQKPQEEPLLEHPHESIGGFFRTHFSAEPWQSVWQGYLTQPPVLVPVGLSAGAAAVSHWDKPLSEHIAGTWGDRPRIGDVTMATLVAGSVALGIFFPGEGRSAWDNVWEEGEAFGLTALITGSLKQVVHRTRPGGGSKSFPSGHTSAAFAAATLIDANSDGALALAVPAYGLASVTGYSRIEAQRHYPSDVLAGAAIGIMTTQILDYLHWGNGRDTHGIAGGGLKLDLEPLDRGAMVGLSFPY